MIELFQQAFDVQEILKGEGWHYCFIGGLAVIRWGEPRFTRDMDITLLTGFGNEEYYIDRMLEQFQSRQDNMREFALHHRVILLLTKEGYSMDVALGGLLFEEQCIERSSYYDFGNGVSLRTCSAEDLIVMKAFADREIDWHDIKGIIIRQNKMLDWNYIIEQLTPLCELKENPGIVGKLLRMNNELYKND